MLISIISYVFHSSHEVILVYRLKHMHGGGLVGGFVGGVLLTAALGAVIFVVLLQRMKLAHMIICLI